MNTHPIKDAVAPLKSDAVEKAAQYATRVVAQAMEQLAANDWDAQKAAPYPSSLMRRADYVQAKARHDLLLVLTTNDTSRPSNGFHGSPKYRVASPEAAARFVSIAREDAAAQYDAFVAKLAAKIGAVDSATLAGSHVWGFSVLTVAKGETSERWQTRQIVNVSKLGKVFNQWPTRKLK